ncbi:hypothetical protein B9Z55_028005 [Caenorhabditis nigoni]|uniref:Uncharacterized protein n=1 Tax=Caenorhabditis nigoni TaxID=1611254 RepID=A0A2G5SE54_9PELO|nr:hypothetical protein B9Z55_028005 [Caenorhabditis nigoni]
MVHVHLRDAHLAPRPASFTPTQDAKSSSVAPCRRLRSADAPTIIQQDTGNQGTPATSTTNQIASRRRFSSGRSTAPVAPCRRLAHPAQPSSSEDTQKPEKAPPFGCPRRRYTKDSGKRSSGVAAASTTVASFGGLGRGRVATGATTGRAQGNDSTAPSSRGREKSSATNAPINTRKRGSQIRSSGTIRRRKFLLRMKDVFENSVKVYFVLEFMAGGDLYSSMSSLFS